MPPLTQDALTERVDQLLEGVIKQIRVTNRTDVTRADLLKLICRRATRNATQRLQRTERSDVSHFNP
jgi:hypothetical protein